MFVNFGNGEKSRTNGLWVFQFVKPELKRNDGWRDGVWRVLKFYYNQHFWIKTFAALLWITMHTATSSPFQFPNEENSEARIVYFITHFHSIWKGFNVSPVREDHMCVTIHESITDNDFTKKNKAALNTLKAEDQFLHCFDVILRVKRLFFLERKKKMGWCSLLSSSHINVADVSVFSHV